MDDPLRFYNTRGEEIGRIWHGNHVGLLPHMYFEFIYGEAGGEKNFVVEAESFIRFIASRSAETWSEEGLWYYPVIPYGTKGVRNCCGQAEAEPFGLVWNPASEKILTIWGLHLNRVQVLGLVQWILELKSWDPLELHRLSLNGAEKLRLQKMQAEVANLSVP